MRLKSVDDETASTTGAAATLVAALVAELWAEAYENGSLKTLPDYLDQTYLLLQESQELNFKRWKILNQQVHMNFQALGSYEAEVQFVKKCIEERLVKFDQYVKNNQ